jgi:hypothetical protein
MPVNSRNTEYSAQYDDWQTMRDCVAGQRAVQYAAERYLPRLDGESDTAYAARKARASFFNATARTIEGLVGMLFRVEPECEVSPGAKAMLDDVTKSHETMLQFATRVAEELNTTNKVAVLTDYPTADAGTGELSVAQVEALNMRPHLAAYPAESIINWRWAWVNNRTMLTLIVFEEVIDEPNPADLFTTLKIEQWRALELIDGVYTVTIYRSTAGTFGPIGPPIVPLMNGQPLNEIPVEIFGDGQPPLLDLANVNISHYQTTADLEHGAHMTALPQPWIAGSLDSVDADGKRVTPTLYIGGGNAWVFPVNTQVGMLEYTGQGLEALENRLKAKENHMAVLGARMLEQQKRGVESAETAGLHRAGEQSILQQQAGDLSAGFTRVLSVFDRWAGGSGQVRYQINKDFIPSTLSAQEITALVSSWQSGAISHETLFDKFQRGGVVSEGIDYEEEQTRIANNPPVLSAPAAPAQNDPNADPAA